MDRRGFLGMSAGAIFSTGVAARAPARELDRAVETLATLLADHYVFPAIGRRYAAGLRANLARGAYAAIDDPRILADRLSDDLAAIARDGHLRVVPIATLAAQDLPRDVTPPPQPPRSTAGRAPRRLAIEDAGWLAGKVAYIRFTEFPDDAATAAAAERFMRDHAAARALVIDCRYNGGGGTVPMNAMLPFLYAAPTTLVAFETPSRVEAARGFAFSDDPTLRATRVPAPPGLSRHIQIITPRADETRLQRVPVYLLVSKRTASAAEHFALALKRTRRATLIGETTAGANHFGEFESIGSGLAAMIPVGRTFDPDTGKDWEGVGITPDIAVAPPLALQEALRRVG